MTTRLLMGLPRSGTTLVCHLLNRAANTVALHEPIAGGVFDGASNRRESPRYQAVRRIEDFVQETRASLLSVGEARSKSAAGVIPTNPVAEKAGIDGLRREAVELGRMLVDKPLSTDFVLLIKHNALFTALLPELVEKFPCYAIVRNPLAVLASWQTVQLPIQRGRIPMGERFDEGLKVSLERTQGVLARQIAIMGWFFNAYREHFDSNRVIRYEDVIASHGSCLSPLSGGSVSSMVLETHNDNASYRDLGLDRLVSALSGAEVDYSPFYGSDDILTAADDLARL